MNKAVIDVFTDTIHTVSADNTRLDWPSYFETISRATAEPLFTIDQLMAIHFPNLTLDQLKHIVSLYPEANL